MGILRSRGESDLWGGILRTWVGAIAPAWSLGVPGDREGGWYLRA
jgi:hypothetical protein